MRPLLYSLLALGWIALSIGCSEPIESTVTSSCVKTQADPDSSVARVVAFGDSITIGVLLDCADQSPASIQAWSANVYNHSSYAKYVASSLGMPYDMQAVGGTRLESDAQIGKIRDFQFNPNDIVLFQPGVNDATVYREDLTYLAKYESLLREAIGILCSSAKDVYIGTATHVFGNQFNIQNSDIQAYGDILLKIYAEHTYANLHVVDTFNQFPAITDGYYDFEHPNVLGEHELASLYLTSILGSN